MRRTRNIPAHAFLPAGGAARIPRHDNAFATVMAVLCSYAFDLIADSMLRRSLTTRMKDTLQIQTTSR